VGCPDAVGAAVKMLPGVGAVHYDPQQDLFSLTYDPKRARVEDIFAAVVQGGKQMGREYRPRLML
jgi:copper chaperone CopZ